MLDKPLTVCYIVYVEWLRDIEMRLAGSNLDGSAKIRPTPKKEMTAAEKALLKKLLTEAFNKYYNMKAQERTTGETTGAIG